MTNQESIPEKVLQAIIAATGKENLGLHEPYFEGNEKKYLEIRNLWKKAC